MCMCTCMCMACKYVSVCGWGGRGRHVKCEFGHGAFVYDLYKYIKQQQLQQ